MAILDYYQNYKKPLLLGAIALAVLVTVGLVVRASSS